MIILGISVEYERLIVKLKLPLHPKDILVRAWRAQELLRLEHNYYGKAYREKEIEKKQWTEFLSKRFIPENNFLCGKIVEARSALTKKREYSLQSISTTKRVSYPATAKARSDKLAYLHQLMAQVNEISRLQGKEDSRLLDSIDEEYVKLKKEAMTTKLRK